MALQLSVRSLYSNRGGQLLRRLLSEKSTSNSAGPPQDEAGKSETVKAKPATAAEEAESTGEKKVRPPPIPVDEKDLPEDEEELVNMWNDNAPGGPEWGGPRGQEPTEHGDWSKGGRVTDF